MADSWFEQNAPTVDWFAKNAPPAGASPDPRTDTQVAWDQVGKAVSGIPQAITAIPSLLRGVGSIISDTAQGRTQDAVKTVGDMVGGMARSISTPILTTARGLGAYVAPNSIKAPTLEEWQQAAQGAGANLGPLLLGEAVAKAPAMWKPVANIARDSNIRLINPRDIAASFIKPPEVAFQFGADPLEAAQSIKPANTYKGYVENVQAALDASEASLKGAIEGRRQAFLDSGAGELGSGNGMDVAPQIKTAFERVAAQAEKDNNSALAARIRNLGDSRIADLKGRYGSTYLDPEQILTEKRSLGDETKFKIPDVDQATINAAKQGMYGALDSSLDQLVPEAASINKTFSGQLELNDLVKKRANQNRNAPLALGHTFMDSLANQIPEIMIKSRMIKLLNYGKAIPTPPMGPYIFNRLPGAPGPYEPGYVPSGPIAPPTLTDAVTRNTRGPYQSGYQPEGVVAPSSVTEPAVQSGVPTRTGLLGEKIALDATNGAIRNSALSNMKAFADLVESGVGEQTGKLTRTADVADAHRIGGGLKNGTPLTTWKQSPGVLAEAIRKGRGPVFDAIQKAFIDHAERLQADSIRASARAQRSAQIKGLFDRQRMENPPF